MGKRRTPAILQQPLSLAIRSALALPLVLGLESSLSVAGDLGRLWATSPMNRKRLPRSIRHIRQAFPEASEKEAKSLAVDSYEHLFRLAIELGYTSRYLTEEGFTRHLHFGNVSHALRGVLPGGPCILISGHCGNWELIGYAVAMLGFPMAAVYRPLDLKPLDAWVREARARRGLTLISKFGAMKVLPPVLDAGYPVGLVADQSGGDRGIFVPFFGRLTSTYKSIGLLAMQSRARIICGSARRMAPGEGGGGDTGAMSFGPASMRYSVELIDNFGPEEWESQPDPLFYLTARYRRAMETMIRKAPEQYLWMHRIWRSRAGHERHGKPFPKQLRAKLESLPWMTQAALERIVERSEQDTRAVAAGEEL